MEAREDKKIKAIERERERNIGENSLRIHAVYMERTLELKIELR